MGGANGEDIEALLGMNGLQDLLVEKTSVIGEKLSVRRFKKLNGEVIASYIHAGGKIGVLVSGTGAGAEDVYKDIAMQIAAMNPQYISNSDISAEELAKLREITVESALHDATTLPKPILQKLLDKAMNGVWDQKDVQAFEENKHNMNYVWNFVSDEAKTQLGDLAIADKASIVGEKMFTGLVDGRVSKQLKEICLLDQVYVKAEDGKQSVAAYLAEQSKKLGAQLGIKEFVRFETGEGLEKREENFAEEVAKQMQ